MASDKSKVIKENIETPVEIMPFRPYNRGKKLKVLHDQPFSSLNARPSLWQYYYHEEQTEFVNIGKRRAIVRKRNRKNTLTVDEDPYNLVQIQGMKVLTKDIWRLPEKPEDLQHIEPVKNTFRSRHTQLLSKELMKIVEETAPFFRQLLSLCLILEEEREERRLLSGLSEDEFDSFQESSVELTAITNEYMERLHDIRKLLIKAHLQKKALAMKLNIK